MDTMPEGAEKLLSTFPPLLRARIRLNWTQADLAKRARISVSQTARIEREQARPSVAAALLIAAAIGEDVATIFPRGMNRRVDCGARRKHPLGAEAMPADSPKQE